MNYYPLLFFLVLALSCIAFGMSRDEKEYLSDIARFKKKINHLSLEQANQYFQRIHTILANETCANQKFLRGYKKDLSEQFHPRDLKILLTIEDLIEKRIAQSSTIKETKPLLIKEKDSNPPKEVRTTCPSLPNPPRALPCNIL